MIGAVFPSGFQPIERVEINFQQMSSVKKNVSFHSPASLEIGRRLLNSASLAEARNSNVVNAKSSSMTQSSFVQGAQDTVAWLSELATQANSGMLTRRDKEAIQIEIDQLTASLADTMKSASFNGQKLMADSEFSNVVSSLQNIDVTTANGVIAAGDVTAAAADALSSRQARLGAEQIILDKQFEANMAEQANLLDAGTDMTGVDMAMAFSQLSGDMILSNVSMAMTAQAAHMDSSVISALVGL